MEIAGYGREYFNDPLGTSAEIWEIIGKDETVTTGGVTYQNAIKVKRHSVMQDMNRASGKEPVELIYWVVKGIDMVKGIGQFSIMGRPLTIELTETNLPRSF